MPIIYHYLLDKMEAYPTVESTDRRTGRKETSYRTVLLTTLI